MPSAKLEVWDGDSFAGIAYCDPSGSDMAVAFSYDQGYLESGTARAIDPAFPLYKGGFQSATTPGAFRDAAPDAWGRSLIRQKIAGGKLGREADEVDYLLGATDRTRQGSLRFAVGGAFLGEDAKVPKLIDIEAVASLVKRASSDLDAVTALLKSGAGSSGGAVPKAAVVDEAESLWLAKFYGGSDTGLWEWVTSVLARDLGLSSPETKLVKAGDGLAFLSKRFDRDGQQRIPYASAATLAQIRRDESGDYNHIMWALEDYGSAPRHDIVELWRRMVFSVAVNNTDDHLGNHGFLWSGSGWRLSPIFDVTPSDKSSRKTSIAGTTQRSEMLDALLEAAEGFGIGPAQAKTIISDTWETTKRWHDLGRAMGASQNSIAEMASSFDALRAQVAAIAM
jgi:serine/threonine-protein kinase HipA